MSKNILLINDLAGYGKVALSAMIPVLSHMKYEIFSLPTALVSNTLDYGKFDILDTTEYMENTIRVWDELGFNFDAVSTGFIVSKKQTELITSFCKKKSKDGAVIFTDPIMGDDGKLYNGVSNDTVNLMRELISCADYIVPNYTEAAYLSGVDYKEGGESFEKFKEIIDKIRALGAKSVVITSAYLSDEKTKAVVGFDHKKGEYFWIPFNEIPVRFPGTGDIFSSVFIGKILSGNDLKLSTKCAMDTVKDMISKNLENIDKFKGIPLELYLDILK